MKDLNHTRLVFSPRLEEPFMAECGYYRLKKKRLLADGDDIWGVHTGEVVWVVDSGIIRYYSDGSWGYRSNLPEYISGWETSLFHKNRRKAKRCLNQFRKIHRKRNRLCGFSFPEKCLHDAPELRSILIDRLKVERYQDDQT